MTSVINVCRSVAVFSNMKALYKVYYWFLCALVSLNPWKLQIRVYIGRNLPDM